MSDSATRAYCLDKIKEQFSSTDGLCMTGSARQGIVSLGFSDEDVIGAIQALTDSDFYKSMSPEHPGFTHWQDVYKSSFKSKALYIKGQSGQFYLLISFKEK
ncbi:type II toxin-antitoxin system MqsR family toxin [Endozoicomonas sp. SCSIO W0465]|uniref:type II toxin-antitoxin system MqsR family toxin n=1 Tax=Endozoicomonas sp. SCSIO W0465 TaxID=2918516 RepID=UPI002075F1DD|nr:type II toxin-antitoxin system MqsR family toxin [Endozoicomonas sp. SCSIO W0465]USE35723.1 type II toxin-antitoxin system MqsR family toxin [Endozoicomonas sp. SCSIO W0465]